VTVNLLKALGLVVALVCVTVLLSTGGIDETPGVGLLAWIVGYLTGNGVAVLRDLPSTPVVWRRHEGEPDDEPA